MRQEFLARGRLESRGAGATASAEPDIEKATVREEGRNGGDSIWTAELTRQTFGPTSFVVPVASGMTAGPGMGGTARARVLSSERAGGCCSRCRRAHDGRWGMGGARVRAIGPRTADSRRITGCAEAQVEQGRREYPRSPGAPCDASGVDRKGAQRPASLRPFLCCRAFLCCRSLGPVWIRVAWRVVEELSRNGLRARHDPGDVGILLAFFTLRGFLLHLLALGATLRLVLLLLLAGAFFLPFLKCWSSLQINLSLGSWRTAA